MVTISATLLLLLLHLLLLLLLHLLMILLLLLRRSKNVDDRISLVDFRLLTKFTEVVVAKL